MKRITLLLIIPLLLGICRMDCTLKINQPKSVKSQQLSSLYALAGEFRTVFANLLWFKVEQYHHEFEKTNSNWTQNKDILSFTDIIIQLDPKFEEAYGVAAQIYAIGYKQPIKGASYLEKGLESNPKSYSLNRECALMYAYYIKDYKRALPFAKNAYLYSKSDFEKNLSNKLINTIKTDISKSKT